MRRSSSRCVVRRVGRGASCRDAHPRDERGRRPPRHARRVRGGVGKRGRWVLADLDGNGEVERRTPLMEAAAQCFTTTADVLRAAGARVDTRYRHPDSEDEGATALMMAAASGSTAIVRALPRRARRSGLAIDEASARSTMRSRGARQRGTTSCGCWMRRDEEPRHQCRPGQRWPRGPGAPGLDPPHRRSRAGGNPAALPCRGCRECTSQAELPSTNCRALE